MPVKPAKKKIAKKPSTSALEEKFLKWLIGHGFDHLFVREYETGYYYETAKRKIKKSTRVDFACVEHRVAIEIEGGIFTNGRHTRGVGYTKDCEKYNWLVMRGWRVLRYTTLHVKKEDYAELPKLLKSLSRVRLSAN